MIGMGGDAGGDDPMDHQGIVYEMALFDEGSAFARKVRRNSIGAAAAD